MPSVCGPGPNLSRNNTVIVYKAGLSSNRKKKKIVGRSGLRPCTLINHTPTVRWYHTHRISGSRVRQRGYGEIWKTKNRKDSVDKMYCRPDIGKKKIKICVYEEEPEKSRWVGRPLQTSQVRFKRKERKDIVATTVYTYNISNNDDFMARNFVTYYEFRNRTVVNFNALVYYINKCKQQPPIGLRMKI